MTEQDAIKRVKAYFGAKAHEADETAIRALLWAAVDEFARETSVTIWRYDIPITAAATYSLDMNRISVIHGAAHIDGTTEWPVEIVGPQVFRPANTSPSTNSGSQICLITQLEDGVIAVSPLGTSGSTLRLYTTRTPIMQVRDSIRENGETATGGTTTTVTFSALSRVTQDGKVANNGTISDYYTNCVIEFTGNTTAALKGQYSRVTNYNESGGTLTFSPVLGVAPANLDTFTLRGVLDINEKYAPVCVDYSAACIAQRISGFGALGNVLMQKYIRSLDAAKKKKYGVSSPGQKGRLVVRDDWRS